MNDPALSALPALSMTYAQALPKGYTKETPEHHPQPKMVFFNKELALELGFDLRSVKAEEITDFLCGNEISPGVHPIAQAYAGHQFGHFVPQLGDGRAHLLGEVRSQDNRLYDLALKGSGRTAFSRSGDGKAALGPMLREVLISQALDALQIPTTRSLSVVSTGTPVYREETFPGAVLARVASSQIRVGTFEYFAARQDLPSLQALLDYSLQRHFPDLTPEGMPLYQRALVFFDAVLEKQAQLVAQWMGIGFIHGVMNTDNTSISGESIDFGPCAFMDAYDPQTVFSSIDHQGRYAYGNQPGIIHWNLARLAETLLPLLSLNTGKQKDAIEEAKAHLDLFPKAYTRAWLNTFGRKLGFSKKIDSLEHDKKGEYQERQRLIESFLNLMKKGAVDFTLAFYSLAEAHSLKEPLSPGNPGPPSRLFGLFPSNLQPEVKEWVSQWKSALLKTASDNPVATLKAANPLIIPRNHKVEEALGAAQAGDLGPFQSLLEALKNPYSTEIKYSAFQSPAPGEFTAQFQTFCGT
jgi:uncharacterized protein YdiU (UPF0061 family)